MPVGSRMNWITRGNALQIDWLTACPPTGTEVSIQGDDLFTAPADQPDIDFENEGGETYLCGNPPYVGSNAKPPKGADRPGGLGTPFDWELLKALDPSLGFMLSGGLTPDTVAAAIKAVRPMGVDVSSGVEKAPGVKDAGLIRAFIENARQAHA